MKQFFAIWNFDLATAIVLLFVVIMNVRYSSRKKWLASLVAVILLFICIISPLHMLAEQFFTAHMTMHVLLLLCVGPAIIVSFKPLALHGFFRFLKRHPLLCWSAGVGIMWFWHVPVVFNHTMTAMHSGNSAVASAEYLSLIAAGMLFSAPLIHGDVQNRIEPLSGVAYLFTACFACSLLGLLITFAPAGTYYYQPMMHTGSTQLQSWISRFQTSKIADQQSAGLIMWVPCCLLYVSGALYLLKKYFTEKEIATTETQ